MSETEKWMCLQQRVRSWEEKWYCRWFNGSSLGQVFFFAVSVFSVISSGLFSLLLLLLIPCSFQGFTAAVSSHSFRIMHLSWILLMTTGECVKLCLSLCYISITLQRCWRTANILKVIRRVQWRSVTLMWRCVDVVMVYSMLVLWCNTDHVTPLQCVWCVASFSLVHFGSSVKWSRACSRTWIRSFTTTTAVIVGFLDLDLL